MERITSTRLGRRDALKLGGLTVSVAALAAACGEVGGSDSPGRVGYAPQGTDPQDYAVDDAVLLRTAASVELTVIHAYEKLLDGGAFEGELDELVQKFVENHQRIADEMNDLAVSVGGEGWDCTNPWMMDRVIEPVLAAIESSDNPERDVFNTVVALEDLTAATSQAFSTELSDAAAASAALSAATLEVRQAAAVVAIVRGAEGYVSAAIGGGDQPLDDEMVPLQFSIATRFGSTGQISLVVGEPNENGVRETFSLQTPSLNSYIYNELEPTC